MLAMYTLLSERIHPIGRIERIGWDESDGVRKRKEFHRSAARILEAEQLVRNQEAGRRMSRMAIARDPAIVFDCPDAGGLAAFYSRILDWEVTVNDGDWAQISPPGGGNKISFQRVEDFRAPGWPDQDIPQQAHLDVWVDDLDDGEAAVLELGATKAPVQPGTDFRVFLDPAGHPFCLCVQ